jgi:hypothetical protein
LNAVHEQTTYRCINPACASTMPRAVAFCPYCGTDQASGHVASAAWRPDATGAAGARAAATTSAAAASAAAAPAAAAPAAAAPAAAARPPEPARVAAPVAPAARNQPVEGQPSPPDTVFGHGARAASPPPQAPQAPAGRKGSPNIWGRGPSAPPPAERGPGGREPIKLRWWIAVLALLAGVWWWAKPSAHKVEKRMTHAVALAHACKAREAQDELIALRADGATPEQLERLQGSLNDEAAACTRRRQREKAWRDTSDAVDAALSMQTPASLDRAQGRLQAFARRYGEDADTRALRDRIDEARHPLADPAAQ